MTRNHLFRLAGTALLASAFALPAAFAVAADTQSSQQSGHEATAKGKLSAQDRDFLMDAAQGGMMEVEASRLALERASSNDVKNFAQTLLHDHTAANEKLQRIAADKGIELPKQLDAKHKAQIDKLSKLKGEAFDRAYMERLGLQDHRKDIPEFEKQAKHGKDADLKAFAEQTTPVLRKHLEMAQKISGSGATAETEGKAGSSAGGTKQ